MRRSRVPLVLALVLAATCSRPARAQDAHGNTFNLELFRPAIDSKGFFTVNASPLLGHLDFSLGLIGSYARDVLVLRNPAVAGVSGPGGLARGDSQLRISDFITAQVQAAIGLFDHVELGVSLPVHIAFGSRGPRYVSASSGNFDSDLTFGGQMVGDLGLHLKARVLDAAKFPVGFAALVSVYAPTGRSDAFLGEGQFSLRPQLILDRALASRRVHVALNAGALIRFDKHTFTDRGTTLNAPGASVDPAANGGNPFCFPAPTLTMAPGTCGTGVSRSLGTQLTYGLAVSGAVVPGKLDLLAEIFGYADVTGSDPDGRHGFPLEWLAGGKVYLASKSYFEFGAGTGIIPGQTGSPAVRAFIGFIFEPAIGDRGGGHTEPPDEPPPADSDREKLPAPLDPCTEDAADPDRCPGRKLVRVRRRGLQIGKVYFETAKAIIKPISYPILDAVAATLADYPQLLQIEVQGHADERGDDDYNMRLTEERAQAVRLYLVEHGVASERLEAHGYGETIPICTEHEPRCWSRNRRVEFIILRQEGEIPGQEP